MISLQGNFGDSEGGLGLAVADFAAEPTFRAETADVKLFTFTEFFDFEFN